MDVPCGRPEDRALSFLPGYLQGIRMKVGVSGGAPIGQDTGLRKGENSSLDTLRFVGSEEAMDFCFQEDRIGIFPLSLPLRTWDV